MREKVKILLQPVKDKYWSLAAKLPVIKNLPPKKQVLAIGTLIPLGAILAVLIFLYWDLPLPTQITSESRNPVSTQILDRNGKLVYEIFESKRRTPVKVEELPQYIKEATIAIEDKDFYKHHGISASGIARAVFKTTTQQGLEGGSTITQQLVKTTLLSPDRTLRRKIREVTLTLIIELLYSKDKILEMYLNNIPYGGTAWGIEAAAQSYFNKPARDLTLAESSLLAGLPAAPTRFSPFGARPELAKDRQKLVLQRMVEEGYISEDEAVRAREAELVYAKPEGLAAAHFALFVKDQLVEKYGQDIVDRGGLRVKTTLDLDLQNFAQEVVATEIAKLQKQKANVRNGAAMITNPQTGEIYAMIGSKDYFAEDEDGKVNIALASRQPGSSIKPLNYALGLMNGKITASSAWADIPTCFRSFGQPMYCPRNYDNAFHGAVQTRFALGNSYNIPAVRMLALNSLKEFVDFALRMGITTYEDPSKYGLSITLGGGEVRMVDMVQAFGVFANKGVKQELVSILEVSDYKGTLLEKTEIKEGDRIIPEGVAYIISHILLDNNARSATFGATSYLNVAGHAEVSVKTGTTQNLRDNWTIGYSPEIVAATWVGNNNNEPMGRVASGVTGASPIWNKIIKFALDRAEEGKLSGASQEQKKHTHVWPQKPSDVDGINVCATTGTLPSGTVVEINPENPDQSRFNRDQPQFLTEEQAGCPVRYEFFLSEFPPLPSEPLNRAIHVYRDTGMPAGADAPEDQIEPREQQILTDPLGTSICLNCAAVQNWNVVIDSDDLPF